MRRKREREREKRRICEGDFSALYTCRSNLCEHVPVVTQLNFRKVWILSWPPNSSTITCKCFTPHRYAIIEHYIEWCHFYLSRLSFQNKWASLRHACDLHPLFCNAEAIRVYILLANLLKACRMAAWPKTVLKANVWLRVLVDVSGLDDVNYRHCISCLPSFPSSL